MPNYDVVHEPHCTTCGADLRIPDAVLVTFSVAGQQLTHSSQVDRDGLLEDVDDLIANGYHAGSTCAACGEALDEAR